MTYQISKIKKNGHKTVKYEPKATYFTGLYYIYNSYDIYRRFPIHDVFKYTLVYN